MTLSTLGQQKARKSETDVQPKRENDPRSNAKTLLID